MRRSGAGGLVTNLIAAASVFATACAQRPPSALDATRDEFALATSQRAGFAVSATVSTKRITRAELDSIDATTLVNAIERLRPTWLREPTGDPLHRETGPSVYVDDTFAGALDELRLIPLDRVAGIQFLAGSSGFDRFGHSCRCDGGVILVITRRR